MKSLKEKFKEILESFKSFVDSINRSAVSSKDVDKSSEALDNAFTGAYLAGENDFNNAHPNIKGGQTRGSHQPGSSSRVSIPNSPDINNISRDDR